MNNKGFTLIELLAVLVILTAIMGIALPSITSSMERTKKAQDDKKKKMLESYAEIYVTDHKNAVYKSIEKIAEEVPVYRLQCNVSKGAVEELFKALYGTNCFVEEP